MKISIQQMIVLSATLAFSSCGQMDKMKKNDTTTDTIASVSPEIVVVPRTIEGVVSNIQQGKDGYTAELKTKESEVYFVTISHSNLTDHASYKTVKIGENLKVTGDFWMMEKENHITVRQIY